MKVQPLKLGEVLVKNNVFLAPMAGYTDYSIRKLQLNMGIGLAFTELVSAKGLYYGAEGSKELLYSKGNEKQTAVQIFGSDPYFMRWACESEYLKPFDVVDINMGCPVPKVFRNGEGSALLTDAKKAESIVKECVKSGKVITVKIRTGQVQGDDIATEYALMAENSGAKLITIHGRVREVYYSGEPDFKAIEKAKKSVKIPVIANGGIFSEEDADKMMEKTGADGVMLARGAIADPFLSAKLTDTKTDISLKNYIIEHLTLMAERLGDIKTAMEFKKFVPYYFKGMVGFKDVKLKIYQATNIKQIIEIIEQYL
ncbi:MAG: tRNA-dihydrouridine synthase family protein [Clostridia bacterium]|nr:tRNA-dihydrouridine synthase family protein [Clostridia bacterium]